MIGATLATAFVIGPLVGGVISELSDWRWLFNMKYVGDHQSYSSRIEAYSDSIPFGLVTILIITNFWPHEDVADLLSWTAFKSIDFLGGAALLSSTGFLVFAMQQAGSQTLAWESPAIVFSFIASILSCIVFVAWEVHLARMRHRHIEPIFPIGLICKRVYTAGLM
jgi:hypothetical protein